MLLQLLGLIGSVRRRALLMWQAANASHDSERGEAAALRIALRALEPPDSPQEQVGGGGNPRRWANVSQQAKPNTASQPQHWRCGS